MESTNQAPMTNQNNKLIPVLVVLLIISSFLIGSLYTKSTLLEKGVATGSTGSVAGAATASNAPTAAAPVPANNPVNVDVSNLPFLGNPDAKVAVVEYTDFQCPFCGQLFKTTFPDVKKNYIDTGKIKYYVADFPLYQIHPWAAKAAEAANCAKEQNKFWEMHDEMFNNQSALDVDSLKKYAANLGLNTDQFNSCLDSGKYADQIKKSESTGESLGVGGTPASFVGKINGNTVNGIQVSGAVPFDSFKAEIDKNL